MSDTPAESGDVVEEAQWTLAAVAQRAGIQIAKAIADGIRKCEGRMVNFEWEAVSRLAAVAVELDKIHDLVDPHSGCYACGDGPEESPPPTPREP